MQIACLVGVQNDQLCTSEARRARSASRARSAAVRAFSLTTLVT